MEMQVYQHSPQKVSSALVHKEFDDDVLVADMRDLLPSWIPARLVEDPVLSGEDRNVLSSLYNVERPGPSGEDRVLGLSALPHRLNEQDIGSLPEDMLQVITQNYANDGISGDWTLKSEYLSEIDLLTLMGRFTERRHHLSDERRCRVSHLLDKVPSLVRPKVSCFTMVMDTSNYFFYRKHHEHVPGMMLIEVVRQAMYAQYYRHSGQTRGQISLSIAKVCIDFSNFVNSNYPLRLQVEDKRAPDAITNTTVVEPTAVLWQLGRVVAVATFRASPIRVNVFKRLRNVKPSPQARFIPVKNIASVASFAFEDGTALEGAVKDISINGLCASFFQKSLIEVGTRAKCALFVETLGFIHAEVEARWSSLENDRVRTGFRIVDIDFVSSGRLREAIKNFSFIKLSRGEL
jgi:hypothetical protein